MEEVEIKFTLEVMLTADKVDSIVIDEAETEYILQQIKFNQPFVIIADEIVKAYSPMQCISITISPIK